MTDLELVDGILKREGDAYTDRLADRGGPTKYGITMDVLAAWRGTSVSADDVRLLTRSEATAIYLGVFVAPWVWVPDDRVRAVLVDWAVTSGPHAPAVALQRAIGVDADGVVGPATKSATRSRLDAHTGDLAAQLVAARVVFMAHAAMADADTVAFLMAHPKSQLHNLNGWLARALALL